MWQYKQLSADTGAIHCRCSVPGCLKEFRHKSHLTRHLVVAHNIVTRSVSPKPIMKTRAAFSLIAIPVTKIARVSVTNTPVTRLWGKYSTIPVTRIATVSVLPLLDCLKRAVSSLKLSAPYWTAHPVYLYINQDYHGEVFCITLGDEVQIQIV